jgi:hypothetical protein
VAAAVIGVPLFAPALRYFGERNTEQLEYGFLQEVLGAAPRDCTVAGVTRVGNRIWEIPSYLVPSSAGRATSRVTVTSTGGSVGGAGGFAGPCAPAAPAVSPSTAVATAR